MVSSCKDCPQHLEQDIRVGSCRWAEETTMCSKGDQGQVEQGLETPGLVEKDDH